MGLLDECVPRPLRRELADHEVRTVVEMGWAGKRNGELMQLLRTETFTVFLTTDDVRGDYERLAALGVEFVDLPEERPYGIDCGFRDPSGNHFRLTQITDV